MPRAGLTRDSVVLAGADLVDETGWDQLSIGLVAERVGVRTPSLYKHVGSQADLAHSIGVLAMNELADQVRDAIAGRSGDDALVAGATAMRAYVRDHPGRYAAGNAAQLGGPDDPLGPASARLMSSWSAMLRGYHLDPAQELHALRLLRSLLHGFATLEADGGFQIDSPVDDSFTWMLDFVLAGSEGGGKFTTPKTADVGSDKLEAATCSAQITASSGQGSSTLVLVSVVSVRSSDGLTVVGTVAFTGAADEDQLSKDFGSMTGSMLRSQAG